MKMKVSYLGIAVVGLMLAPASFGQAQQENPPAAQSAAPGTANKQQDHAARSQQRMEEMAKELNLTDDQKSKVQELMKSQHEKMTALRNDTSLSQEQKQAKMKELHESMHTQMNAILTPEQQKKWAEERKEMHQQGMGHKGHGGQKGQGSTPGGGPGE